MALPAGFSLWATPKRKLVAIANQASKNVSDLVLPAPKTPAMALPILSLAEVGTTVSADHLLQMATMPLEHKPTALGIPHSLPVSYQFDGAEELLHSQHALFGLLATANTPRYCLQATGFGQQLCAAAGTDSAHILSIALSIVSALQSGRSTWPYSQLVGSA